MQRRLNISCGIVHQPKVLVMDEPTVGVDPQSRNHILESTRELARRGSSIIYTSHYMEEIQALCESVIIMDEGQIVAEGPMQDVITQHAPEAPVVIEYPEETTVLTGEQQVLAQGVEITSIREDRPTLETVFLNLTGKTLRD